MNKDNTDRMTVNKEKIIKRKQVDNHYKENIHKKGGGDILKNVSIKKNVDTNAKLMVWDILINMSVILKS